MGRLGFAWSTHERGEKAKGVMIGRSSPTHMESAFSLLIYFFSFKKKKEKKKSKYLILEKSSASSSSIPIFLSPKPIVPPNLSLPLSLSISSPQPHREPATVDDSQARHRRPLTSPPLHCAFSIFDRLHRVNPFPKSRRSAGHQPTNRSQPSRLSATHLRPRLALSLSLSLSLVSLSDFGSLSLQTHRPPLIGAPPPFSRRFLTVSFLLLSLLCLLLFLGNVFETATSRNRQFVLDFWLKLQPPEQLQRMHITL